MFRTCFTVLIGAAIWAPGCAHPGSDSVVKRTAPQSAHTALRENSLNNGTLNNGTQSASQQGGQQGAATPSTQPTWHAQLGQLVVTAERGDPFAMETTKSADAILGLARVDHLAGRRTEARRGFERALAARPDHPQTLDAYAQFCLAEKQYDQALELSRRAVTLRPDVALFRYHLAVALTQAGNPAAAFPHFAQTVGEAEAHYNVGYLLYERGDVEAAETEFLQALQLKPELAEARALYDRIRTSREKPLMLAEHSTGQAETADQQPAVQSVPESNSDMPRVMSVANTDLSLKPARSEPQPASSDQVESHQSAPARPSSETEGDDSPVPRHEPGN